MDWHGTGIIKKNDFIIQNALAYSEPTYIAMNL